MSDTSTIKCQSCESHRVVSILAKCHDRFSHAIGGGAYSEYGYVPECLGVGGNEMIGFSYCLDCGQIQGEFPLAPWLGEG